MSDEDDDRVEPAAIETSLRLALAKMTQRVPEIAAFATPLAIVIATDGNAVEVAVGSCDGLAGVPEMLLRQHSLAVTPDDRAFVRDLAQHTAAARALNERLTGLLHKARTELDAALPGTVGLALGLTVADMLEWLHQRNTPLSECAFLDCLQRMISAHRVRLGQRAQGAAPDVLH